MHTFLRNNKTNSFELNLFVFKSSRQSDLDALIVLNCDDFKSNRQTDMIDSESLTKAE